MGSGIAEVCARSGVDVTVVEVDPERCEKSQRGDQQVARPGRARRPRVRGGPDLGAGAPGVHHVAGRRLGRRCGDRGDHRGRDAQARDVPPARRPAARRAVPGLEHVVGADHEARRRDVAAAQGDRAALLQPGAGAAAGRDRALDHDRRRDRRPGPRVRRGDARQAVHRLPGPCRLRRQRAADPLPAVGDPDVRVGLRLARGHRPRDGARLRAPDGAAAAERPDRARHAARGERVALRGVPRPGVGRPGAAEPHGRGGDAWAARAAAGSTTTRREQRSAREDRR